MKYQSIADYQQALKMAIEEARIDSLKPIIWTMGQFEILILSFILTLMVGVGFQAWWDTRTPHRREKR